MCGNYIINHLVRFHSICHGSSSVLLLCGEDIKSCIEMLNFVLHKMKKHSGKESNGKKGAII